MPRIPGTFNVSFNLEPQIKGPLDARTIVDSYADLTGFTAGNYLKNGFIVSVFDTDITKRGVYQLIDENALGATSSWMFIGANNGGSGNQGFQGPLGYQGFQGPVGITGTDGNQGFQGFQGFQGPVGITGTNGNQGFQGFQGLQGPIGITGTDGNQGFQGFQGFQGLIGITGNQGPQGFQGLQGPQGFQGRLGPQGVQGVQGVQGRQGFQGFQGLQGPQGRQGFQGYGPQGPQGTPGNSITILGSYADYAAFLAGAGASAGANVGDSWILLSDGSLYSWNGSAWFNAGQLQGPAGLNGSQGPQGRQGFQGLDGNQGRAGNFGGDSLQWNIGSFSAAPGAGVGIINFNQTFTTSTALYLSLTDATGASATSWLTSLGSSTNTIKGNIRICKPNKTDEFSDFQITGVSIAVGYATLSVSSVASFGSLATGSATMITFARAGDIGPQGFQGPIGITGTNGNQGFQGFQGPLGITGTNGTNGNQGFQGFQGPIGITGTNGTNGNQGFQGFQGPIGITGITGITGTNGNQGFQGFQGPIGITGTNGTNGNQGFQGPQGRQGVQGPVGITGTNGTNGNQGFQGFQGPIGITGTNGTNGNQGFQGFQGLQGPIGITGTDGTNGNQGFQGFQGAQGTQGFQGGSGITTIYKDAPLTGDGTLVGDPLKLAYNTDFTLTTTNVTPSGANGLSLNLAATTIVAPTIASRWTMYKADGSTLFGPVTIASSSGVVSSTGPVSSSAAITVPTGTRIGLTAAASIPAAIAGQGAPTAITGNFTFTPSPPTFYPGTSSILVANGLTANTTYSILLSKPKTGLITSGSSAPFQIVRATGNDTSQSVSTSVTFSDIFYYGYLQIGPVGLAIPQGTVDAITPVQIQGLTGGYRYGGKAQSSLAVNDSSGAGRGAGWRFIFAYPSVGSSVVSSITSVGDLIPNITASFIKATSTVSIVTVAGATYSYYVYIASQDNSYAGKTFTIT